MLRSPTLWHTGCIRVASSHASIFVGVGLRGRISLYTSASPSEDQGPGACRASRITGNECQYWGAPCLDSVLQGPPVLSGAGGVAERCVQASTSSSGSEPHPNVPACASPSPQACPHRLRDAPKGADT